MKIKSETLVDMRKKHEAWRRNGYEILHGSFGWCFECWVHKQSFRFIGGAFGRWKWRVEKFQLNKLQGEITHF